MQDVDTPKSKKVSGVTVAKVVNPDSLGRLMRAGFLKGVMQVSACGALFALYVNHVGL